MKYISLLAISFLLSLLSCQNPKHELVIFHAGSLSVPFRELADTFGHRHPEVDVKLEAEGSVICARKITEFGRRPDIMASADIMIIHKMLIPDFTDTAFTFAGNEMVLAFNENAPGADTLSSINWPLILLDEKTKYGRSNPDLDPCGYRSILTMKLQEKYFSDKELTESLLKKDRRFIRPKETDLLALLETMAIDYMFIYRSVAEQHELNYIKLNDTVNLSDPALKEIYDDVSVTIAGKTRGDSLTITGRPMVYGICILRDVPDKKYAEDFIELLKSQTGIDIIRKNGQNVIM